MILDRLHWFYCANNKKKQQPGGHRQAPDTSWIHGARVNAKSGLTPLHEICYNDNKNRDTKLIVEITFD